MTILQAGGGFNGDRRIGNLGALKAHEPLRFDTGNSIFL
jgi:hypothetical protein